MKRRSFTPRHVQPAMIAHLKDVKRCALFASMGLGKTVCTLTALKELRDEGETGCALIIAPRRVAESVWVEEALKWEHLEGYTVATCVSPVAAKRMKLLAAFLANKNDALCINFESLEWLVKALASLGVPWPFTVVVVDESSKLRGFRPRQGTQRAKVVFEVSMRGPRLMCLTGTPAPKGLENIWPQAYFLDQGKRLGKSMTAFHEKYFRGFALNAQVTLWTPLPGSVKAVMTQLKDLCLTVAVEDVFKLDKPNMVPVYVDMPPAAAARYKELQTDAITEVGGEALVALNSAVLAGKLLQFASGTAYTADGTTLELFDEKLQALEEVVDSLNGEPLVVCYVYRSDLARLKKKFPDARELKTAKDLQDWNEGRISMLLIQPQSAGHGLNLQEGGRNIAFFTPTFDLELYQQVRERLGPTRQMQSGHNRIVNEFYLLTRGTYDMLAMKRLEGKAITQDDITAVTKRL